MKSDLRVNTLALLLASGLIFGGTACTKTERETTENKIESAGNATADVSEEAYNNFRTYVEENERDTAIVYDNDRDWNKEISDREAAYNERVAAVDKYASNYDEARRAEIEDMKARYDSTWTHRRATYASYGKVNTLRPQLLNIDENAADLNTLTAANIRASYENFVKQVEANKKNYSNEDWKAVEVTWNELDDRKNAIQNELSSKDKYEIAKAKTKYLAMKNTSKVGNTAENLGSNAKDAGKEGASKVGNTAEKVGSNVKDAAKTGAEKTGDAAKKVGSESKDLYKKAEDKVDGTKDRK
jgi:hypothetical protein